MLWVIFLLLVISCVLLRDTSKKTKIFRFIAAGTIALFLLRALLLTYATYSLWSNALPSKYLLPPYQPISYFLRYSFIHFFASFLLTCAVACVVGSVLLFLKFRRPHLLTPYDLSLLLTGTLLVRWPLDLLYIGALFIGGVLLILFQRYIIKKEEKITFSAHILFWVPVFLLFGNMLIVFFDLQPLIMPL